MRRTPGCGLEDLQDRASQSCAPVIQLVPRHPEYDRGIGITFFYFTFINDSKQDE